MEAVFLGTGTSVGVPFIGCDCAVCQSGEPRNQRLRSSVWLRGATQSILIDCGPDFRAQALRAGIRRLDAVFLSHGHYDHLAGLDDLRLVRGPEDGPVPIYGSAETLACVRQVFSYAFNGVVTGAFKPVLPLQEVPADAQEISIAGVQLRPLLVDHGGVEVLGVRVGDFAYIPDCKTVPESTAELLHGLANLAVDGLRVSPHATHMSRDEAIALVGRVKPQRAWLTHLTHDYDYERDSPALPAGVALAYDGLVVEVTVSGTSSSAS